MKLEPKRKPFKENETDDSDPLILAYRIHGPRANRGFVRVHRSELEKDKSLAEVSKSALSHRFDLESTLNIPNEKARSANPHVERKIQHTLMTKEVRRKVKAEGLTLESIAQDLEITSMNDPAAHFLLEIVTNDLKGKGLWRDEDKDLTMSEAFPLSQAKTDSRIRGSDLLAFERGTFLTDADLTHEDRAAGDSSKELPMLNGCFRLPTLATPMLHNLMRAAPRDLHHQMARRMIDSHYFEDHEEARKLFRACYMMSRGVESERHFYVLMSTDLGERFGHYTFDDFRLERIALKRIIRESIDEFFIENPAVKRSFKKHPEHEKRNPRNIWARFYSVWDSLTLKQRDALEKVYVEGTPKSSAAVEFGISLDSLNSRLKTAVQRLKSEFSDLDGISPKRLPRKLLSGALTHNGLWRYETARLKGPLSKVNPKTNLKSGIEWKTLPKARNLDWKQKARIKAEIIENCPVPHFHETEYFDGMKPTILSFSRSPGNLKESGIQDREEDFRDL